MTDTRSFSEESLRWIRGRILLFRVAAGSTVPAMKWLLTFLPLPLVFLLGLASCNEAQDSSVRGDGAASEESSGASRSQGESVPGAASESGMRARLEAEDGPISDPSPPAAAAGSAASAGRERVSGVRAKAYWNEKMLHDEIRYHNPDYSGSGQFQIENGKLLRAVLAGSSITSLECFRGMALEGLDLSGNPVSDLAPLAGQPLGLLYIEDTMVEDLTPLRGVPLVSLYAARAPIHLLAGLEGAPLEELNVIATRVADLSPVTDAPLKMVWLTGCPVTDISPIAKAPLVSLTLHKTPIIDLSPLAGSQLNRLHIAETKVTDLSPLRGLPLTRLVFSPSQITSGMEAVRALSTMREIGSQFDDSGRKLVTPPRFWGAYDTLLASPQKKEPVQSPASR